MQLRMAFLLWLSSVIGLVVIAKLCLSIGLTQWITIIYYIAVGVFLSKKVLAELVTWDGTIYNTIDNVSGAKLGYAMLWIIRYPVLFFKLGIMKIL